MACSHSRELAGKPAARVTCWSSCSSWLRLACLDQCVSLCFHFVPAGDSEAAVGGSFRVNGNGGEHRETRRWGMKWQIASSAITLADCLVGWLLAFCFCWCCFGFGCQLAGTPIDCEWWRQAPSAALSE